MKSVIYPTMLLVFVFGFTANAQQPHTKFYEIKETGVMYEYMVLNNQVNGKVAKYQDGKLIQEGWSYNNQPHSTWKQYNMDGSTTAQIKYLKGKKHGVWKIWDDNGNLRYQYQYNKGKRSGTWEMYSENGELLQSKVY